MATTFSCVTCNAPVDSPWAPPCSVVCPSCRTLLQRDGDAAPTAHGVMPPAPAARSGLALGASGEADGARFQVVGRTVLSQGRATWNEWCLKTQDGATLFISDAQGALHQLKLRGPRPTAPAAATLAVGTRLEMEPGEVFHVREVGESVVVTLEGAVPYLAAKGARTVYADLDAAGGALATLDWREGAGATPDLWDGYPTTLGDLGLEPQAGTGGPETFTCGGCQNTVTLHLGADACTFGCSRCGGLAIRDGNVWKQLESQPSKRERHLLPPGRSLTIRGEQLQVTGSMRRSCVVDGESYGWREYFCVVKGRDKGPVEQRHRWLVEQDGHWMLMRPLPRGDAAQEDARGMRYQGDVFREFSTVRAVVEHVVGEHPYATHPGAVSRASDFVAPPRMLSCEEEERELFWTVGEYIPRKEMQEAAPDVEFLFTEGVAPAEPNPLRSTAAWMVASTLVFWAVILLVYFVVAGSAGTKLIFSQQISPAPPPPVVQEGDAPTATPDTAFYSEPLEVNSNHRNMRVEVVGNVDNAWEAVDVTLIHEATGEVRGTTLSVEAWHGQEGGESWSEGDRSDTAYLADVLRGTHILRVDADCELKPCPPFTITLYSHSPRPLYAFMFMFLLALCPLLALAYSQYLETRRWENSAFTVE